MTKSGYTGISFPFRVGSRGGCVMSTTSETDPTHIIESIKQIFGTNYLERVMEPEVYSELDNLLFEPNDETLQAIIQRNIEDAIERLEERVEIASDGMVFKSVQRDDGICYLFVDITFTIIKYETQFTQRFNLGEVSNYEDSD